jgi:hypothetical protein
VLGAFRSRPKVKWSFLLALDQSKTFSGTHFSSPDYDLGPIHQDTAFFAVFATQFPSQKMNNTMASLASPKPPIDSSVDDDELQQQMMMKSSSDKQQHAVFDVGMEINAEDHDDGLDDHFDPDDLLTSPLFTNGEFDGGKLGASFCQEAENSFGNFVDDADIPEDDAMMMYSSLHDDDNNNIAPDPITISDTCSSEDFDEEPSQQRPRSLSSGDHSFNSDHEDYYVAAPNINNNNNNNSPIMTTSPQQQMMRNHHTSPAYAASQGMSPIATTMPLSFHNPSPQSQNMMMMTAQQGQLSPFHQGVRQQQPHPLGLPSNVAFSTPCMQQPPCFDDDHSINSMATNSMMGVSSVLTARSIPDRNCSSGGNSNSSGGGGYNSAESFHQSPARQSSPGFLGSSPPGCGRRGMLGVSSPVRRPLAPATSMGLHQGTGQTGRASAMMGGIGGGGGQKLPARSQSYNGGGGMMRQQQQQQQQVSSPNKLQLMQLHLQKVQELELLEQMQQRPNNNMNFNNNNRNNAMGLSQSMHGPVGAGGRMGFHNNNNNNNNFNGMMMNNNNNTNNNNNNNMALNRSFRGDQLSSHSSHAAPSSPSFNMGGNVSIASDVHNMKGGGPMMMNNGFHCDQATSLQQQQQQQNKNNPATVNDVMEKLCESMKRSAMSRSMIKQFSGRSAAKQGGGGSSGRQPLSRSNSGHSHAGVERSLSNRGLMKQGSIRMMTDESGIGRGGGGSSTHVVPIRRQSSFTKHQLQHPARGVYRHDSQRSLGGQSTHSISLHVDGRNVGTL